MKHIAVLLLILLGGCAGHEIHHGDQRPVAAWKPGARVLHVDWGKTPIRLSPEEKVGEVRVMATDDPNVLLVSWIGAAKPTKRTRLGSGG